MTDEMEKVENAYEREARILRERETEKHEMVRFQFKTQMDRIAQSDAQHESNLLRDAAIVSQSREVTEMAASVTKLTREQTEGQKLANEAGRRNLDCPSIILLDGVGVRHKAVVAVEPIEGGCRVLCTNDVVVTIKLPVAEVVEALRAAHKGD